MDKTTPQDMLVHAERLCAQRGVRLTTQRLEVLRLMTLQQGAISAYDLLDLLKVSEPQAKPPRFIARWNFCSNRVSCIRSNPPTAMCCVT